MRRFSTAGKLLSLLKFTLRSSRARCTSRASIRRTSLASRRGVACQGTERADELLAVDLMTALGNEGPWTMLNAAFDELGVRFLLAIEVVALEYGRARSTATREAPANLRTLRANISR